MFIQKRKIMAADEVDTNVAPEASDLLFEAEDVAELVAEVTGQPVEVTADENEVVFAVGEDEFTVTAEGDEEVLEAVRKPLRNKSNVKASASRKPAQLSKASKSNMVRKIPRGTTK